MSASDGASLQAKGGCREENAIIVPVNVRTTPSNCAITNSCLLMQWCMMAPQTDWVCLCLSCMRYSLLMRAVGSVLVLDSVVAVGADGECSDSAKWCVTLTWRQSGWGARLVSSTGLVPGPPVPSAPAPHYARASGQVPQLLFSLPSN